MDSTGQILKTVKRSNFNTLLISLIGLVIVGVLAAMFMFPYFYAKFTGPIAIAGAELTMLNAESSNLYFREVVGDRMRDTLYYEETVDEDSGRQISIDAYFGALEVVDGKWILVRHFEEINTRETEYVGMITPITDSVATQVLRLAGDELNIALMPVMLDTVDHSFLWYMGAGVLGVVGAMSLWGFSNAVIRSSNPYKHPTFAKLGRFGDVESVVDRIEKDYVFGEEKVGKLTLTRNFAIHATGSAFDAIPYTELVWIYKMIISGRYGKTYQAHLCDRSGFQMIVIGKEQEVNDMLTAVMAHAPWSIAGFSDEIKKMWNKDRASLIMMVDQRKNQTQ